MRKYITVFVLLIAIIIAEFTIMPRPASDDENVDLTPETIVISPTINDFTDYVLALNDNEVSYSIVEYTGSKSELKIPNLFQGKPITSIESGVFASHTEITNIQLPLALDYIGEYAFKDCVSLTEITIPSDNDIEIDAYAFYNCLSIKTINLPCDFTLKSFAFYGCSNVEKINMSAGNSQYICKNNCLIEKSYNKMILGCSTSVIPSTVEIISKGAFTYCNNLLEIIIPASVIEIEQGAFIGCKKLTNIDNKSNEYKVISNCLIENDSNTLIAVFKDYVIPEETTSVGSFAFSNTELTKINISDIIFKINDFAFAECLNLTDLEIGKNVNTIGKHILYNSNNINVLSVDESNTTYSSENNCILKGNTLYFGCQSSVIPSRVSIIGEYAFYSTKNLSKIEIPEGITLIGNNAFANSNLTSITLPNSLQTIEENAFYNCSLTKSLLIGSNLSSIGQKAFTNCYNIETIQVNTANSKFSSEQNCLIDKESKTLVLGCKSSTIPANISIIGEYAFYNVPSINEFSLPTTLTKIDDYAFAYSKLIDKLIIPNTTISIGNYSFYKCDSIKEIEIGNGLKSIGQKAFKCCDSFETLTLKCYELGKDKAFNDCQGLVTLNLAEGCAELSDNAFNYCFNLETVNLSNTVSSIGDNIFKGCSLLKELKISNNNPYYYSVNNCVINRNENALVLGCKTSVVPQDIKVFDDAFNNCTTLTSIYISKKVTEISDNTFCNCTNLRTVYLNSQTIIETTIYAQDNGHVLEYANKIYVNSLYTKLGTYIIQNFTLSSTETIGGIIYNVYTR